ncbi:alanine racemase [Feifania hominis]|uniref:Alanine racemase n=1 Tax=Feifania hominis TaxID=2763660 RepID=A0A926DEE2_9FIRM|nr:alanine racemase [Feifania hominis]MBC8536274.1 alanine racemase [Feifania hominis]
MNRLVVKREDLAANIGIVREAVGQTPIIGVVKGDGYGLSAVPFARELLQNGVTTLAVSRVEEAVELRENDIESEILVMSPTSLEGEAQKIIDYRLTAAVGSLAGGILLNNLAAAKNVRVKAHLKLDTGFGRYGFLPEETDKLIDLVQSFTHVDVTGVFSHFSSSFERKKKTVSAQLTLFLDMVKKLKDAGIDPGVQHIANSCAALRFPETRLSAVRVGSAFLGRLPVKNRWKLRRIAWLECELDEVRHLPAGHNIGYTNIYKTKAVTKTAVVTLGYGDGLGVEKSKDAFRFIDKVRYTWKSVKRFLRRHNELWCTVGGKRCYTAGRLGLTNTVVDVTGVECKPGDVARFECNPLLISQRVERVYE